MRRVTAARRAALPSLCESTNCFFKKATKIAIFMFVGLGGFLKQKRGAFAKLIQRQVQIARSLCVVVCVHGTGERSLDADFPPTCYDLSHPHRAERDDRNVAAPPLRVCSSTASGALTRPSPAQFDFEGAAAPPQPGERVYVAVPRAHTSLRRASIEGPCDCDLLSYSRAPSVLVTLRKSSTG